MVPVEYKGLLLEADLRLDVLVEDLIIVELKSKEGILSVHEAQVLPYMKLLKKPKGILINFNCTNIFKEGQKHLSTSIIRSYLKNNFYEFLFVYCAYVVK